MSCKPLRRHREHARRKHLKPMQTLNNLFLVCLSILFAHRRARRLSYSYIRTLYALGTPPRWCSGKHIYLQTHEKHGCYKTSIQPVLAASSMTDNMITPSLFSSLTADSVAPVVVLRCLSLGVRVTMSSSSSRAHGWDANLDGTSAAASSAGDQAVSMDITSCQRR